MDEFSGLCTGLSDLGEYLLLFPSFLDLGIFVWFLSSFSGVLVIDFY